MTLVLQRRNGFTGAGLGYANLAGEFAHVAGWGSAVGDQLKELNLQRGYAVLGAEFLIEGALPLCYALYGSKHLVFRAVLGCLHYYFSCYVDRVIHSHFTRHWYPPHVSLPALSPWAPYHRTCHSPCSVTESFLSLALPAMCRC